MSTKDEKRGLLAHSAKAAEEREKFLAMRETRSVPASDSDQLKYFLFFSRTGMTCAFAFGLLFFLSGLSG